MKAWKECFGWFGEPDGEQLQILAKDKVCVEVGSYEGRSTVALLEVAQHVNAVDYFRSHKNGQCQEDKFTTMDKFKENTEGADNLTVWIGSSLHACRNFEDDSIDLVFIDALHTYEAVLCDIVAWYNKLKMGGTFCFHDYMSHPPVKKAVDTIFPKVDVISDFAWTTKQFSNIWERK